MATPLDRWLKQHAAGEAALAKVLRSYFKGQRTRIIEAAKSYNALPPSVVGHLFHEADETKLLLDVVSDPIIEMMAVGAADVLSRAKKPKSTKAFETKAFAWNDFELPQAVKDSITASFIELEGQQYWKDIQATTKGVITDVLQSSLEDGETLSGIVKRLGNELGIIDEVRAMAIARTESTGAYNSGHQDAYAELAGGGLIDGKEWMAVVDGDTRPAHVAADNQEVGPTENFVVGGESCPYPGWHGLSAKQRVGCRCTTGGIFSE